MKAETMLHVIDVSLFFTHILFRMSLLFQVLFLMATQTSPWAEPWVTQPSPAFGHLWLYAVFSPVQWAQACCEVQYDGLPVPSCSHSRHGSLPHLQV